MTVGRVLTSAAFYPEVEGVFAAAGRHKATTGLAIGIEPKKSESVIHIDALGTQFRTINQIADYLETVAEMIRSDDGEDL